MVAISASTVALVASERLARIDVMRASLSRNASSLRSRLRSLLVPPSAANALVSSPAIKLSRYLRVSASAASAVLATGRAGGADAAARGTAYDGTAGVLGATAATGRTVTTGRGVAGAGGVALGRALGTALALGAADGALDAATDGAAEGLGAAVALATGDGEVEGAGDGDADGDGSGEGVGASVGSGDCGEGCGTGVTTGADVAPSCGSVPRFWNAEMSAPIPRPATITPIANATVGSGPLPVPPPLAFRGGGGADGRRRGGRGSDIARAFRASGKRPCRRARMRFS